MSLMAVVAGGAQAAGHEGARCQAVRGRALSQRVAMYMGPSWLCDRAAVN